MNSRADLLRHELAHRVVVADGAMGTMLQGFELDLDDFEGLEGCNEILCVTRPDVVRAIHDAYFEVGCDAVETNSFGANLANLAEYDIADRIYELAEASARIAREVADGWSTPDHPRFVLGSVGPGTKLPTLGHTSYAALRDAYQSEVAGLVAGGADAILVETAQDLLQAKAAVIGARRALTAAGSTLPLIAQVTVETTGTMLLGSEIGAALTALEPLGIDLIGLNCATGPAEMGEHLRYLARHARVGISCMPNAGLPVLGRDGASYPLTPVELADAHDVFTREHGLALVGGCCGTTPAHLRLVVERVRGREVKARRPHPEPGSASLYQSVAFRQDTSYLAVGERTNANGSRVFRDAMLEGRFEDCVEVAREATRDGSHLLDLCVDYVGRDGVVDMRELASRFATASTLPLMLDSTEPQVIEAGLECLGGRSIINSVNFEDGEGPASRFARIMPIVREHGAAVVALTIDETGQARTPGAQGGGRRAAYRDPDANLGHARERHPRRLPDVHSRYRTRREPSRWLGHDRGHPRTEVAPSRRPDDSWFVEYLVRIEAGRACRAELGVSRRMHEGRPRCRDRACVEDPASRSNSRRAKGSGARSHLRPPSRGLRSARRLP